MRNLLIGGTTLLALCAPGALDAANTGDTIGQAAAVVSGVSGALPGESSAPLATGDEVYFRQQVETADNGRAQFLFLDETTLQIGPNSQITLDEFVYTPGGEGGTIGVTMTRGLTRLIGGRVSKSGSIEVKTPHGALAVRGGIADFIVGEQTLAILRFGFLQCGAGGNQVTVTLPGAGCVVTPDGQVSSQYFGDDTQNDPSKRLGGGGGGNFTGKLTPQMLALFCNSQYGANDRNCSPPNGGLAGFDPQGGGEEQLTDDLTGITTRTQQNAPLEEQCGECYYDYEYYYDYGG